MLVSGGKSIYGARIGILMLEAQFPRILGDMGNAETWPFPVLYKIVRGATPDRVVRKNAEGTLDRFIAAAEELVSDGADAITTNCGFLSIFQKELSAAVRVPVLTSSLMQVGTVNMLLPDSKKAGILTISKSTLSDAHLRAANVPLGTPIGTTEDGAEFSRVILNDELQLNIELARMDNINAALKMKTDHPELGAIILECTNMSPYAKAMQEAVELPVYSIVNFVEWLHAGLKPKRFFS